MIIKVMAPCLQGEEAEKFDGLECDVIFDEYVDSDWPKGVTGGYMSFMYKDKILYVITEYDTKRKLNKSEEAIVIDYTQGQWSDGIGEGFEQQYFDEEKEVYNPSPWYPKQIVKVYYE